MVLKTKSYEVEEKWNAYSHAVGIVLSIIGMIIFSQNNINEAPTLCVGIWVYSISLILLFTASTIYHKTINPKTKKRFRILDHISIYYLIAGTYTPVCLTILADSKGELLLYLVWSIAIFGTLLKLFFTGRFEVFSLVLYGVMGWLIVLDLNYLTTNSSNCLFYLGLGGLFYTVGIVFYASKKIPFNHFIWHLFVLGGAISHWLFVYKELILKPIS